MDSQERREELERQKEAKVKQEMIREEDSMRSDGIRGVGFDGGGGGDARGVAGGGGFRCALLMYAGALLHAVWLFLRYNAPVFGGRLKHQFVYS